jgi:hypothetical protein
MGKCKGRCEGASYAQYALLERAPNVSVVTVAQASPSLRCILEQFHYACFSAQMNRSQAGSNNSTKQQQPAKAKTKAVHKEAAFRQVASDWTQKATEVQGLDVLERCKKLNAFLSKV